MFTVKSALTTGDISVVTSNNGPLSPQQWATIATNKIIHVGNETDGPIREQALAYQSKIQAVIEYYIKEAIRSHEAHLLNRR
jgi:hypothetical protein